MELSTETQSLDRTLSDLIATSKAIGWLEFGEIVLTRRAKELLGQSGNVSVFHEAVFLYDSLPLDHKLRKEAPYDLVHNAQISVTDYFASKGKKIA